MSPRKESTYFTSKSLCVNGSGIPTARRINSLKTFSQTPSTRSQQPLPRRPFPTKWT